MFSIQLFFKLYLYQLTYYLTTISNNVYNSIKINPSLSFQVPTFFFAKKVKNRTRKLKHEFKDI